MADFSGGFWMERTIGASAGAAVSLIYMLPADRREAACRFVAGRRRRAFCLGQDGGGDRRPTSKPVASVAGVVE